MRNWSSQHRPRTSCDVLLTEAKGGGQRWRSVLGPAGAEVPKSLLLATRGSPLGIRPPFFALSRCYYPIRVRRAKARAQSSPGGEVQQPQRPRTQQHHGPNAGFA